MPFDGSDSSSTALLDTLESALVSKSHTLQMLAEARERAWRRVHAAAADGAPRLLLQGDSWFDFGANDLADALQRDHGHAVTSIAVSGSTLQEIVDGTLPRQHLGIAGSERISRLEDTLFAIEALRPHTLLLSAGGNDMGRDALMGFLGPALLTPADRRVSALRSQVDTAFRPSYECLIALVQAKARRQERTLPIVLHGYEHLQVSARAAAFVQRFAAGYQAALAELVRGFVDAFNAMLADIARTHAGVHHADLRGTLTQARDWVDELHPSPSGFSKLATGLNAVVRGALAAH